MTIEITRPEVEALIRQRMRTGAFSDPQDVILHALRSSPESKQTGADLIAVLQSSPHREVDLAPERFNMPLRDSEF